MNYSISSKHSPDHFCATLCGAFAMLLYWVTLAPTVTGEDGGELIAAAYTLGIPHPTGYPLWTMLAHLFGLLLPIAEYACRISFMSAFFAAATVYFLVLFLRHLNLSRICTITAALTFAASREFWEQSVIAEVYTLNAFFVILCIYLLLRWTESKSPTTLYLFTIIYSLSLSNHSTMYLLGPWFLCFIFYQHRPLMRQYKTLGYCVALFLISLLVHLYLPIRSRTNPAMDWGNPETFQTFWDVFTRVQYSAMMNDERSLGLFSQQLLSFCKYYLWEFTPWVLLLAMPGLYGLYKSSRTIFALTTGVFSLVLVGSIIIPNFAIEYYWVWLNTTYWIPCYLITAIWIGYFMDYAQERLKSHPRLLHALSIIIILSPLIVHFEHNDQSNYYYSRDYAQNLLDTLDENALYFGEGDHAIFPITYLHIVEGKRSDITIGNQYGYISPELYTDMPDTLRSIMPRLPRAVDDPIIFDWILKHTDRPVYSTRPRNSLTHDAIQHGLLYQYYPKDSPAPQPPENLWESYHWTSLDPDETHNDWTAETIVYEYHYAKARASFTRNEDEEAMHLIRLASQVTHGHKQAVYNLGMLLVRNGYLDEAKEYFIQVLDEDSDYISARYNLTLCYMKKNDFEKALIHSQKLIQDFPDDKGMTNLHKKILQNQSALQDNNSLD